MTLFEKKVKEIEKLKYFQQNYKNNFTISTYGNSYLELFIGDNGSLLFVLVPKSNSKLMPKTLTIEEVLEIVPDIIRLKILFNLDIFT